DRRTSASDIQFDAPVDRVRQSRQAACAGGDLGDAFAGAARPAHHWRFLAGLRRARWTGLCAPRNIPAEVIERLNKEINAALADQGMKARLADLGNAPMPMTPAEFINLVADETDKWGKVIRAANIKAE